MFCVLCVSVVCITLMICVLYVLCVYIRTYVRGVLCVCYVLYDWRIIITLHSVQVMVFPMNCSQCQSPCETRMKSVGIH